jgi:hypothetical protein
LLDELPTTYDPVVRYPNFYGLPGRPMGLHFDFNYNLTFASQNFTDQFFRHLGSIGAPGDLTVYQQDYNDQENNVLDVADPVLYIDAPSVEQYLMNHSRRLGIDPGHSYTIFFINWYGRSDFQFHVYTKTDEPDPDTGYNFGELRDSRKIIAWGGEHGRTWFYDLSAGPEYNTTNWNVDDPDLTGDGVEEYRMPPVWEYTPGGYRDPAALSTDLGYVTRFVGIDLLFTTSPLYDPLVTAPQLNGDKVVHIEMFEDDPGSNGLDWIDPGLAYAEFERFEPYYDWQVALEDNDPIDPAAQRSFRIFTGLLNEPDCWNMYGTPFAQLYCYFHDNLGLYVPAYDAEDYVGEVFAFNTTDDNMGNQYGLLGFADDNWMDGTQTYVFQFDTAGYRDLGYGFTSTTVHEMGHHIGLSHPHDGYDPEYNIDYGPDGFFYFVWVGDESDTLMHYLALSNEFSKFDEDNMYRYEMAGYLNWANDLLDDILADPNAHEVLAYINRADNRASQAMVAFRRWDYAKAVSYAHDAYLLLTAAADELGITPAGQMSMIHAVPRRIEHQVDPIRLPDN